jgi:hypothetical protein
MLLLTAGVNKARGGGLIWPHTNACLARQAATIEAVEMAFRSALSPMATVPFCQYETT